jgi:hypothetical protein
MKKLIAAIVMAAPLFSLTGCAHLATHGKQSESFRSFIEETREAQADDYIGKRGVRVKDQAAFEQMRRYLLDRYKGVHVSHSFVGSHDEDVDCIPIAEQMSLKSKSGEEERVEWKLPEVPAISGKERKEPAAGEFKGRKSLDITLKRDDFDQEGNERYCEDDTIPVRRVTLDDLVRFPDLNSFFRKGERRDDRPIPGDSQHYYARGVQFVDNFGADSWLNVWSPTVASDQMSLSQIWVVADTGNNKQTVEAGWQVYPDKWDSDNAALFTYYTTGGYQDGTGCYNVDCSGFVQTANNVYLGSGFDHYSATDQTQWGFELQYKRNTDGNWWLFYRGPDNWIPVGYYPHSLFGAGALSRKADKIAFGGEDTGTPSAKQMGSGTMSNQGFGKSAFQNTIFYIDTNTVSQWANLGKEEPDPTCYDTTINNIYGNWGTYLYFGGPSCN